MPRASQALVAATPSAIKYDGEKPDALLEEDKLIGADARNCEIPADHRDSGRRRVRSVAAVGTGWGRQPRTQAARPVSCSGMARVSGARPRGRAPRTGAELAGPPEVLRVPLHAEAEASRRPLDRFDHAVRRRGGTTSLARSA